MDSKGFLRIVSEAFVPFLTCHGFEMDETDLSGRLYEASFRTWDCAVSVSYEPGDDALFIMVFKVKERELSSIDDRSQTPRLSDLNNRYQHSVTFEERRANELLFKDVRADDETERQLLNCAKQLSLVLPKYLQDEREAGAAARPKTL